MIWDRFASLARAPARCPDADDHRGNLRSRRQRSFRGDHARERASQTSVSSWTKVLTAGLQVDGQLPKDTRVRFLKVPPGSSSDLEGRETGRQRGEGDLPLRPRQRCSDAKVWAEPEGDVPVRIAPDVECIRVREVRGITIGSPQHLEGHLARAHGLTAKLDVAPDQPWLACDGTLEAQDFLDGLRD